MNVYTPRPGSRTAAAVEYLLSHGAAATAIDLAEACDTERKNLPATLKAAIDNGLIEACDLPEGKGYRMRGLVGDGAPVVTTEGVTTLEEVTTPPTSLLMPDFLRAGGAGRKRVATVKKTETVATPPATEIRPYLGAMPKAPAAKPRKPKAPAADHVAGPRDMVAPAFRIGHYSDGSVRLEGLAPAMVITDGAGELPNSVMLAPEAALLVARFLGAAE